MRRREFLAYCAWCEHIGVDAQVSLPWEDSRSQVRLFQHVGPLSRPTAHAYAGRTVAFFDPVKVRVFVEHDGAGERLHCGKVQSV